MNSEKRRRPVIKMTSGNAVLIIGAIILIVIIGVFILKGPFKQEGPSQRQEEIVQEIEKRLRENHNWQKALELFKEGVMLLNNSEGKEEFLKSKELLEKAKAIINDLETNYLDSEANYLTLYWKARIDLELGLWFEVDGNKRKSEQILTSALETIERSIKLNDSFSDCHRLLGEVLMRLIDFKGTLFAITAGPKAKQEIEKALRLNPENVEAYIALGLWFLFTPGFFGGNIDEAIRSLKRAEELAFDEHQRFLASMWLGKAFLEKGEKEEAKGCFLKALKIYPKSVWAKKELERVKG